MVKMELIMWPSDIMKENGIGKLYKRSSTSSKRQLNSNNKNQISSSRKNANSKKTFNTPSKILKLNTQTLSRKPKPSPNKKFKISRDSIRNGTDSITFTNKSTVNMKPKRHPLRKKSDKMLCDNKTSLNSRQSRSSITGRIRPEGKLRLNVSKNILRKLCLQVLRKYWKISSGKTMKKLFRPFSIRLNFWHKRKLVVTK